MQKHVNFTSIREEIWKSREREEFTEKTGMYRSSENRGEIEICGKWLKEKFVRNVG